MSSATVLISIQTNVYRFGGPLLIIIGTISCTLNLLVFTKRTLRQNPCSVCLIAVNITNLLFIYFGTIPIITQVGYNIDPSITNIVYCRFRYYASNVFSCLGPFYLILASIDRTLITSRNAATRKRSTRRLAIISIIALALFWLLFHIHEFIYVEILQVAPNTFFCFFQPGIYSTLMTYYTLIINGIVPPLLMTVFSLWTVKNVSKVRRTVHATGSLVNASTMVGRTQTLESKDHQLIRMLLLNIAIYIVLRLPLAMYLIYQQITQYESKNNDQMTIEQFVLNIAYFLFILVACVDCYTNLLASKTFRTELKRTFVERRIFHFR